MTTSRILFASSILFTVLGSHPVIAQMQPSAVDTALRDCLALTDNLTRLTCYDNLARARQTDDSARTPEPASAPIATSTAAAPAPAETAIAEPATIEAAPVTPPATAATIASEPTPVAEFGQTAARVEPDAEGAETLVDRVVEARRVEPTKWLLTLQSGQLWRQSVGKSYVIRPGDTVRISPSSWGTDYRLSVEGRRGYIQVTRQE